MTVLCRRLDNKNVCTNIYICFWLKQLIRSQFCNLESWNSRSECLSCSLAASDPRQNFGALDQDAWFIDLNKFMWAIYLHLRRNTITRPQAAPLTWRVGFMTLKPKSMFGANGGETDFHVNFTQKWHSDTESQK
jgi:hypothetical protein